jgi:transaldolase / glucose-6-phosphate isomerase
MNPLRKLAESGQSVWLDFLSRDIIANGELKRLIAEDSVAGVTSNPAIFEKAIGGSTSYDGEIARLSEAGEKSVTTIYEQLATADVAAAADLFRPLYEQSGGRDGLVSLEVSPYLAMDTQATIDEARALWRAVDRPNIFIKVPGTAPGIPAIRTLLAEGININVTLLFSQQVYDQVMDAFFSGLEERAAAGQPIERVASVASFFVSRIDSVADKLIEQAIARTSDQEQRAALAKLAGKVAIANAKLAYARFQERFAQPRWQRLAQLGAAPQRLLWASTGTKNPAYSDVVYVEELNGPDTVNTMPGATIDAFRDHGRVRHSLTEKVDEAAATLAALVRAGISLDKITDDLARDGVKLFADAFDKLLGAIAAKRRSALGTKQNKQTITLPPPLAAEVSQAMEEWRAQGNIRRLWRKDATLWSGRDEANWLGWLDIVDDGLAQPDGLQAFARDVSAENFHDAVLIGMGGSSLGAEVLSESLGSAAGFPHLHVLDSTDPEQIANLARRLDIARTLFIVASKSGSTLEPNVLLDYFFAKAREALGTARAGKHFVAITDPGSKLQQTAEANGFRAVFFGVPAIGGRYSVLSNFGLVPLVVCGHDAGEFLRAARVMVRACGSDVPPAENAAVALGLTIGILARGGRDKLTLFASPSIASFGAWVEQLIAESTGKDGRGVIPVVGEPLGAPAVYDADRFFVYLRDAAHADKAQDAAVAALERAGHPLLRIEIAGPKLLAQEFFRFELATAVAGAVLAVNPFDQPNVEASKVAARAMTDAFEKTGLLPLPAPVFKEKGIALFTDERNAQALRQAGANSTLTSWLKAHFGRLQDGDYFALLAYFAASEARLSWLQELRAALRDSKRVATCLQFGPRYLHSTGQAYQGGPNSGVFFEITAEPAVDLDIPGRKASFGVIESAQALGDFRVLGECGRRVLRGHIGHDLDAGLATLGEAAQHALQ